MVDTSYTFYQPRDAERYLGFPDVFVVGDADDKDSDNVTKRLNAILAKTTSSITVDDDGKVRLEFRSKYRNKCTGQKIKIPAELGLISSLRDTKPHVMLQFFEQLFRINGYPDVRVVYFSDDDVFSIYDNDAAVRSMFGKPIKEYVSTRVDSTIRIRHPDEEVKDEIWVTLEMCKVLGIVKRSRSQRTF